ncbi:MAG: hypothetical protein AAF667_05070 [Pseudomonadota bacterium]
MPWSHAASRSAFRSAIQAPFPDEDGARFWLPSQRPSAATGANITLDDLLAACRTYREINITPACLGDALQPNLRAWLSEVLDFFAPLEARGANGPAFQMAKATREDCASAVGYRRDAARRAEYAQKSICNSARMRGALNASQAPDSHTKRFATRYIVVRMALPCAGRNSSLVADLRLCLGRRARRMTAALPAKHAIYRRKYA